MALITLVLILQRRISKNRPINNSSWVFRDGFFYIAFSYLQFLISLFAFLPFTNFCCCCFLFLGEEHNFLKLSSAEINSLNEPYDYASIMHYGKYTFAREGHQVTILPKKNSQTDLTPEIGQREKLSIGDIRQTEKMYRCPGW